MTDPIYFLISCLTAIHPLVIMQMIFTLRIQLKVLLDREMYVVKAMLIVCTDKQTF